MRYAIAIFIAAQVAAPLFGQALRLTREQMLEFTVKNPYDRFPDGRPKVDAAMLERVKGLSLEEAWGYLMNKGYKHQYTGWGFEVLHPGKKLVGRAFTAQFLPLRPDTAEVFDKGNGKRGENQKVIDLLQEGDVPVIDLMGASFGHTFGGSNLHAAIYGVTHTGAVIDGMVRDVDGIRELPTQVYFRKAHPSAVAEVSVTGINVPIHIGDASVMPGDVVLGDSEGVIFIPPHLVKDIVEAADLTHIHDEWTISKFLTGKFKASELYGGAGLSPELKREYDAYVKQKMAERQKSN
jgi:4-hydroxy-4-methyl-2-oxoglutarate aldolase